MKFISCCTCTRVSVYGNCIKTVINAHKREYFVIINLILIFRRNRLASPLVRAVSLLSGRREFELTSTVSYDFYFPLDYYAKQYVNSKIVIKIGLLFHGT